MKTRDIAVVGYYETSGTGWETTPWRAVQNAAWEALANRQRKPGPPRGRSGERRVDVIERQDSRRSIGG